MYAIKSVSELDRLILHFGICNYHHQIPFSCFGFCILTWVISSFRVLSGSKSFSQKYIAGSQNLMNGVRTATVKGIVTVSALLSVRNHIALPQGTNWSGEMEYLSPSSSKRRQMKKPLGNTLIRMSWGKQRGKCPW